MVKLYKNLIPITFKKLPLAVKMQKSENSMLALALASGVIGFLVQSMFDYTFYNYRVMAVFFMVMGLGMALRHISVPYRRETE